MSDLQRQFAKAKLASLPPTPPRPIPGQWLDTPNEAEEDGADDSSSTSSTSSTGTIIPSTTHHLFARPRGSPNQKALEPIPWTYYFDEELHLTTTEGSTTITHHAYYTRADGGPLFVTHHGAGSSGLSFGMLAAEIRKIMPSAGMLSLDARGHGTTTIEPRPEVLDLSLETLSEDLILVITKACAKTQQIGPKAGKDIMSYPIILVGHSLGGAVVTNVAKSGELGDCTVGYAVLDVVEGSAIDALQSMQTYLSTRPLGFPSLEAGIDWHIRTRTIRNSRSARTSVPALLKFNEGMEGSKSWTWRTNLAATQPFWEEWFKGLSKKFLEAKGGKLLLLAGTDRLDKELMIGQMQGKYALQVFPDAGHFIHEDAPEKTALYLVDFYKRNSRILVMPPKVADLLRAGKKV